MEDEGRGLAPEGPTSYAVGIDLSARRGLDLAVLDERLRLITLIHLPDLAATLDWLDREAPAPLAIGIDAPQGPRLPLLTDPAIRAAQVPPPPDGRYLRYRVCDYQLARRGIGLYLSPAADEPVPGWMAVGFALFAALRERGFRAPGGPNDTAATLLEVYPYATFVTLLGAVPPSKSTPEGLAIRRRALEEASVTGLPAAMGHDALDAAAAALATAAFAAGQGCALGDPAEGLMVLPVPAEAFRERYGRRGTG